MTIGEHSVDREEEEMLVIWGIIKYINDKSKGPATLTEIYRICWAAFGGEGNVPSKQRIAKLAEALCQKGYAVRSGEEFHNPSYIVSAEKQLSDESVVKNTIKLLDTLSVRR